MKDTLLLKIDWRHTEGNLYFTFTRHPISHMETYLKVDFKCSYLQSLRPQWTRYACKEKLLEDFLDLLLLIF